MGRLLQAGRPTAKQHLYTCLCTVEACKSDTSLQHATPLAVQRIGTWVVPCKVYIDIHTETPFRQDLTPKLSIGPCIGCSGSRSEKPLL